MEVVAWCGVVVEVGGLEGRVEPDLGDSYGRIGVTFYGYRRMTNWSLNHMFALQAAAVDTAGEGAGAVPRRVEDIIAAFEL